MRTDRTAMMATGTAAARSTIQRNRDASWGVVSMEGARVADVHGTTSSVPPQGCACEYRCYATDRPQGEVRGHRGADESTLDEGLRSRLTSSASSASSRC